VNFDPIAAGNETIHHLLPPRPEIARRNHGIFLRVRDSMRDRILFPHATTKGVSSQTADRYRTWLKNEEGWRTGDDLPEFVNTRDILRAYIREGIRVDGDSELRQKWYPTGLKPRTYYCNGGKEFLASTHLRDFFNDLCDEFDPCNRFSRVDVSRLKGQDGRPLFVYDYSSFTSNFSEHFPFLCELAEFFRGTRVFLVGPELSLISADLGAVIQRYADTVNDYPTFSIRGDIDLWGAPEYTHQQAGFLGVYGNLATCTLPHALLASFLVDRFEQQSTAGDDGSLLMLLPVLLMHAALCLLGSFALDKCYVTSEPSVYLKRPLIQRGDMFFSQEILLFPTLVLLEKDVPRKFSPLHLQPLEERVKSVVVSLRRTMIQYSRMSGSLSPFEEEILRDIYEVFYVLTRTWTDPRSDPLSATDYRSSDRGLYLPELPSEGFFDKVSVRDRLYPVASMEVIRVRKTERIDLDAGALSQDPGSDFYANQSRLLKLLVICGYIEQEDAADDDTYEWLLASDEENFSRLRAEPDRYRFVVRKTVPEGTLQNLLEPIRRNVTNRRSLDFERFADHQRARRRYLDLDDPRQDPTFSFISELEYDEENVIED